MNTAFRNILAICIGILPLNAFMIWYRLTQTEIFTTSDMLLYPLLLGGGNILLILALNKYLLKESFKSFNSGTQPWYRDILSGTMLALICFMLMFAERATLSGILSQGKPPSQEVLNLMFDLTGNPLLLAIWLGPVVWIGVAMFEEISRAFFLNCLWRLTKNKSLEFMIIFLVSTVIGFTHLYQGTFGIVTVIIQGLVVGFFYYKYRRIWPLVISHALYDSIQIIMFVIQVNS
jgi:membrane protease YdiL (CAAX protease family)